MNWDWDKLQGQRQGGSGGGGGGPQMPNFDNFNKKIKEIKLPKFPVIKVGIAIIILLWLASGIYIVQPSEAGVVLRFGALSRITDPGPHYALPYPIEAVLKPNVTQIRRAEIGLKSLEGPGGESHQYRAVSNEGMILTGDENIVNLQFIVQYQIKDPVAFLFKISQPDESVKAAAQAAMREVVGRSTIDAVLTSDKLNIQNEAADLLQEIMDRYESGIRIVAVQLQDVHPPNDVSDAFKDVASAREDKIKLINEADAYRNDILPRARGDAARMINEAQAYKDGTILRATGEAARFTVMLSEYAKAPEVTRERLYLETMEALLSNSELEKVLLSNAAMGKVVPYLPMDKLVTPGRTRSKTEGNRGGDQ